MGAGLRAACPSPLLCPGDGGGGRAPAVTAGRRWLRGDPAVTWLLSPCTPAESLAHEAQAPGRPCRSSARSASRAALGSHGRVRLPGPRPPGGEAAPSFSPLGSETPFLAQCRGRDGPPRITRVGPGLGWPGTPPPFGAQRSPGLFSTRTEQRSQLVPFTRQVCPQLLLCAGSRN